MFGYVVMANLITSVVATVTPLLDNVRFGTPCEVARCFLRPNSPGPVFTNKFEPETQAQAQRFRASSDEPQ